MLYMAWRLGNALDLALRCLFFLFSWSGLDIDQWRTMHPRMESLQYPAIFMVFVTWNYLLVP